MRLERLRTYYSAYVTVGHSRVKTAKHYTAEQIIFVGEMPFCVCVFYKQNKVVYTSNGINIEMKYNLSHRMAG